MDQRVRMGMIRLGLWIGPETEQVRAYIAAQGNDGATLDEIKAALDMQHAQAARHLALLLMHDRVAPSGARRGARSNPATNVYIAVEN